MCSQFGGGGHISPQFPPFTHQETEAQRGESLLKALPFWALPLGPVSSACNPKPPSSGK